MIVVTQISLISNLNILVPDDNVHLSHTPPLFGKLGSLILDIAIASYSTALFFHSFSLFYSTGKTVTRDKPGAAAPAPNVL